MGKVAPSRRWFIRWLRRGVIAVFVVLLLLFVTWNYLTSSWFLVPRVERVLSELTGGMALVDSANYEGDGVVGIRELRVYIRDFDGPAGRLITIPEVDVHLDKQKLRRGRIEPTHLTLRRPHVRLSEDEETGIYNLGSLSLGAAGSGEMPWPLPLIQIEEATVEVGSHDAQGVYQESGCIELDGQLVPEMTMYGKGGESTWYQMQFAERLPSLSGDEESDESRLSVSGRYDISSTMMFVEIGGLGFEAKRLSLLPAVVRDWWEIVQPDGELKPLVVDLKPNGEYRVAIAMDGVDWTIPLGAGAQESDENPIGRPVVQPRMTDVRGSVILHNQGVELEGLTGTIDGVSYLLTGSYSSISEVPGFHLEFKVQEFDLHQNLTILDAVPGEYRGWIDQQLSEVTDLQGVINAKLTLHRDAVPGSRLQLNGNVEILNASGTFGLFPYPLHGMNGKIQFDETRLFIEYLAALGPDRERLSVIGEISPLAPGPMINLDVVALNVPIHTTLREAVDPQSRDAIDQLFYEPTVRSLREAGALISPEDKAECLDEIVRLKAEIGELTEEDSQRIGTLREKIASLEERCRLPVFALGGRVNLTTNVNRVAGLDQPTDYTTRINLTRSGQPLGMLYRDVPYPMYLREGELVIGPERIEITKKLFLDSPSAGYAMLSGLFEKVQTPRLHLEPNLQFTAIQMKCDPLLLRAIPSGTVDAPPSAIGSSLGKPAQILAGFLIDGSLISDGHVMYDDTLHRVDYDFKITLEGGSTLLPDEAHAEIVNLGWVWPAEYLLTDVKAVAHLRPDSLTFDEIEGVHGNEHIQAHGVIDWARDHKKTAVDLSIHGDQLQFEAHLIDLLAGFGAETQMDQLRDFWSQYDPKGQFDLDLSYQLDGHTGQPSHSLAIRPSELFLTLGEHRIGLERASGTIGVESDLLRFDGFQAEFSSDEVQSGSLSIDGEYGLNEDRGGTVTGSLLGGRFEWPVLSTVLERMGQSVDTTGFRNLDPSGQYDATFRFTFDPNERVDFEIDVEPETADFTWKGQRFKTRGLTGRIRFLPSMAEIDNLGGVFQDGEFSIDGDLRYDLSDQRLSVDVGFEAIATSLSDRVLSFVPNAVTSTIEAIDLTVNDPIGLTDARIQADCSFGESSESDSNWKIESFSFDGDLAVHDATMNISVPVTDMDATVHLHVDAPDSDAFPFCEMEWRSDRMRVSDRLLTGSRLLMVSDEDDERLVFPKFTASCYGGRVEGHGRLSIPDDDASGRYAMFLTMTDVDIESFLHPPDEDGDVNGGEEDVFPQRSSGLVFARLDLTGVPGDASSRSGLGAVRVYDATLYELPLTMWALQLSSLSLPISTSFNYANMDFFISGDEVEFEEIYLESPTMSLKGRGTLDYANQTIDLLFDSKALLRTPVLTDIWEAIRNALFTIRIHGPIDNPRRSIAAGGQHVTRRHTIGFRPNAGFDETSDLDVIQSESMKTHETKD